MSDLPASSWQTTLRSEAPTPSLPGQALASTSTTQHSQSPDNHCHLGHRHHVATCFPTIDAWPPQRPTSTGYLSFARSSNVSAVSTEVHKLPSTFSAGVLTLYYSGHVTQLYSLNSGRVTSSLGYITDQNGASSIVSPLVDQSRSYWGTQDHDSHHVTNHNTTPSLSHTSLLELCAMGYTSRCPQENENISTFGDLAHSSAGPTMGSISALYDHTSGLAIDSNAPWSQLSSPFFLSPQELRPSDGTSDNIPLRPEQIQTMMGARAQFPSGVAMQEIIEAPFPAPYSYTFPTPPQSNSTSYSTNDDHMSMYSFMMPRLVSSSQRPQGHIGALCPTHTLHKKHADFPASRKCHSGNEMKLCMTGTDNNCTLHVPGDHPLSTRYDHGARPGNRAAYILDDYTVGDYGNSDKSPQVVSPRLQSSLPSNEHSSPHKRHSHDRVSRIKGGSQSQTPMKPPGARSVYRSNVSNVHCGWRNDINKECGAPIKPDDCVRHFAHVHGIKRIASHVTITCRWCPLEPKKELTRKYFLRHLKEQVEPGWAIHLGTHPMYDLQFRFVDTAVQHAASFLTAYRARLQKVDNRTVHIPSDLPLPFPMIPERTQLTIIRHAFSMTTLQESPGVVHEYGSFDESKHSPMQVVGSDSKVLRSVPSNLVIPAPRELDELLLLGCWGRASDKGVGMDLVPLYHKVEEQVFIWFSKPPRLSRTRTARHWAKGAERLERGWSFMRYMLGHTAEVPSWCMTEF
ncbi:hypothetical protein EDC04DRAFT_2597681 [Pisolithus marmoratus]|nr:hypothetical protein EDC04DRAFT_2597681 [Pisolithus marmoratus]